MSGGGVSGGRTGRYPDALIHEFNADPERLATAEEVSRILEHIARAPFNTRMVRIPPDLVGEEFLGEKLGEREDSLTAHLAQRVLSDDQWVAGTTREEFLGDIKAAVAHPQARLAVYETRDTAYVTVVSPNVMPEGRRGNEPGEYLAVYYSANRGRIISAVQALDEREVRVPERARWLR